MSAAWRYAFASAAGTSHGRRDLPCQDACACRVLESPHGEAVLVAVVADGAGSARRAADGSALTCSFILGQVEALLSTGGAVEDITRGRVEIWLAGLQGEVRRRAETEGLAPREFASTLVAAAVGGDRAAFWQVGDGAAVVAETCQQAPFNWVFWPLNGEYENVTFFATEPDAAEHLEHALVTRAIDELALFSDGLQRLALHYPTRTAHAPFFESMFAPLRAAPAGSCELLAHQLAAFLDSPRVNDRTDDDKTLALATRRPVP
jgi:hypothetical protein